LITTIGRNINFFHKAELRDYQITEVDKMLSCGDSKNGFIIIHCKTCDEDRIIHFSCNSRICPKCGQKYVKTWVVNITERMYDVDYSHIIFTLPKIIWDLIEGNWKCIGELYKVTFKVMKEVMQRVAKQKITPGMIVAGHTFGKDVKWNVHFHSICTEGGLTKNGLWKGIYFFPYEIVRSKWKYASLKIIKKYIKLDFKEQLALETVYHDYKSGFNVKRIKGKMKKKELAGYIARYIRHPAISNRRIIDYDSNKVTIIIEDKYKKISWNEEFSVDNFMGRLIKHIPPKGFQVVRHYGIYSKRKYDKSRKYKGKQEIIQKFLGKKFIKCYKCGENAEIIMFFKPNYWNNPPPNKVFGELISDWCS